MARPNRRSPTQWGPAAPHRGRGGGPARGGTGSTPRLPAAFPPATAPHARAGEGRKREGTKFKSLLRREGRKPGEGGSWGERSGGGRKGGRRIEWEGRGGEWSVEDSRGTRQRPGEEARRTAGEGRGVRGRIGRLRAHTAAARGSRSGPPAALYPPSLPPAPWWTGALCWPRPSSSTCPSGRRSSRCWRSRTGARLPTTTSGRRRSCSSSSLAWAKRDWTRSCRYSGRRRGGGLWRGRGRGRGRGVAGGGSRCCRSPRSGKYRAFGRAGGVLPGWKASRLPGKTRP